MRCEGAEAIFVEEKTRGSRARVSCCFCTSFLCSSALPHGGTVGCQEETLSCVVVCGKKGGDPVLPELTDSLGSCRCQFILTYIF